MTDTPMTDSLSQHCPNCEAQAAEIEKLREIIQWFKMTDIYADARIVAQRHREEGAAEERAKIVAYARGHGGNAWSRDVLYFAEKVEAKEHLK